MALQFDTTVRTTWLSDLNTAMATAGATLKLYSGTIPTNCGTAIGAQVLLASFTLATTTPLGTPSAGATTIASLPLSATTGAAGTASFFRINDSGGTCHIQGTVGTSGSDLNFDNNVFTSGQTVQITGFTLTSPGA